MVVLVNGKNVSAEQREANQKEAARIRSQPPRPKQTHQEDDERAFRRPWHRYPPISRNSW